MAEIDVLKAQIVRQDLSTAWGFELQGGADIGEPLRIQMMTPGSPAARIGLRSGDEVTEIGDLSTEGLAHQQVLNLIEQYGETLVLTVERRAHGTVPGNPVLNSQDVDPLKSYQTYDMSGNQPAPRNTQIYTQAPQVPVMFNPGQPSAGESVANDDHFITAGPIIVPGGVARLELKEEPKCYQTYDMNCPNVPQPSVAKPNIQFQTVKARPFEDQPRPYYSPVPVQSEPQVQTPPLSPTQQYYNPVQQPGYSPDFYDYDTPIDNRGDGPATQSRTFKVLETLMTTDAAGADGLPPPRSIAQEQWKAEQAAKRASPRVKVFMPQQYNSPLGMYSAKNVVETFQAQAGTMMDHMERQSLDNHAMSDVQRAVLES